MGKALLIQDAQKARGLRCGDEAEGFVKKVLAMIPIVIPLFISSLELAEKLGLAMESRGFVASDNLTYSRDLKMQSLDYAVLLALLAIAIGAISLVITGFGTSLLGTLQELNIL